MHGVITRRFSQGIAGTGRVFGVKFRPGGFGAFTGADVGAWTDRVLPLAAAFGDRAATSWSATCSRSGLTGSAPRSADAFLLGAGARPRRALRRGAGDRRGDPGRPDPHQRASWPPAGTRMSERTLQRLFRRYVGVGPKWVLQRARLHDAVDRIDTGRAADLATLAVELGWFDQAHFTREFTALVGQSPAAYAARR